jgi:hypothetical protein
MLGKLVDRPGVGKVAESRPFGTQPRIKSWSGNYSLLQAQNLADS